MTKTKTCKDCKMSLDAGWFRKSLGTPDGLDIRCVDCARAKERARRTKKCSQCKQTKPRSHFARQSMAKDGLQYQCRECCKVLRRRWGRTGTSARVKTCAACASEKTLKSFAKDPRSNDGRQDTCWACVRESDRDIGPAFVHHHEFRSRLVEHEPGSPGYRRLESERENAKNAAWDALRANREEVLGR